VVGEDKIMSDRATGAVVIFSIRACKPLAPTAAEYELIVGVVADAAAIFIMTPSLSRELCKDAKERTRKMDHNTLAAPLPAPDSTVSW
jgi:hypothetical protein